MNCSHDKVYNTIIIKPKPNQKPQLFLQNLPKPTDRKNFETLTTLVLVILFGSKNTIIVIAKYYMTECSTTVLLTHAVDQMPVII